MDYTTAYRLLLQQGNPTPQDSEALLIRLQQQKPPIPGQITSLLLALKVVYEGLKGAPTLDREFVNSLYLLGQESRYWFEQGQRSGVNWPPLLEQDLGRIGTAVRHIFADRWES
jgi:hypothetical protein